MAEGNEGGGAFPRLRQVALVAGELDPVAEEVRRHLSLGAPFADPGVAEFGLHNAVFTAGDTFLEVVSPVRDGTAAGRHLQRLGGDGGYMAIFQVADVGEARRRVADLGVRVVWSLDLPDMAGTHLHPHDVPGAIVSLDAADPPGSWRWAGTSWAGAVPRTEPGGIVDLTVAASDPAAAAARWAAVLGVAPVAHAPQIRLGGGAGPSRTGGQRVTFVPAGGRPERITAVTFALPMTGDRTPFAVEVGGVRIVLVDGGEHD